MDTERATNRKNLAKSIDPSWDITQVLQRLIAHFDEYTDVFEGEELSLDMVRNWHQQEIAKARIDELANVGGVNDSYSSIGHLKTGSVKDRIATLKQELERL